MTNANAKKKVFVPFSGYFPAFRWEDPDSNASLPFFVMAL